MGIERWSAALVYVYKVRIIEWLKCKSFKNREKINAFSVVLQTPVTKLDCTILLHLFFELLSRVSRYAINLFSVLFACSQALQDIGSLFFWKCSTRRNGISLKKIILSLMIFSYELTKYLRSIQVYNQQTCFDSFIRYLNTQQD